MDKAKQKLLDKLGKKGFDTEKKVNAIDMQVAFDNGLADEIGGILALHHTTMEVKDLDELRDLINSLPEGTVYSLNLEVVELGQET